MYSTMMTKQFSLTVLMQIQLANKQADADVRAPRYNVIFCSQSFSHVNRKHINDLLAYKPSGDMRMTFDT